VKLINAFNDLIGCDSVETAFKYFIETLNESNTRWDYFVDWNKVFGSIEEIEIDLNTLNYLVGKEDIECAFKTLLKRNGRLARLIPILLACRKDDYSILTSYADGHFIFEKFNFENKAKLTNDEIEKAYRFSLNTGLLDIFKNKNIKNVLDYVIGVEVGLDSNGRKNRGGTTMERIVEELAKPICEKNDIAFMTQATATSIKNEWGLELRVDKSSRRFDMAFMKARKLCLLETNYYGGGGSKLKATAGEYKSLYDFLSADGHSFVWVTDGVGWSSTLRPLEETFRHIDYTLNLNMVSRGILESILINELVATVV